MSIFKQIPPTAGFPFFPEDIFSLFSPGSLEDDFRQYLNAPFAAITYSGAAACYFILESVKSLSPKRTVIVPAYICPLVPLAAQKAGLQVLACDINEDNFGFDLNQLKELCGNNNDILAVIPAHLGGIPVDVGGVKDICEKNNIFVIEDCAQSLGASFKDKKTGAAVDFSFFSLCRGKGLTIYEGGAIAARETRHLHSVEETIRRLSNKAPLSETLKIMELSGYWLFYRPFLFWFVFNLPQKFWLWRGQPLKAADEYYSTNFPIHGVSRLRKRLGHLSFPHLASQTDKQREKAARYLEALKDAPGITCITETKGDRASYPFLTLLFEDSGKRDKIIKALDKLGLGASLIYLEAITDYDYLKGIHYTDVKNARQLARRHLRLTTSVFLKQQDIDRTVEIIKNLSQ